MSCISQHTLQVQAARCSTRARRNRHRAHSAQLAAPQAPGITTDFEIIDRLLAEPLQPPDVQSQAAQAGHDSSNHATAAAQHQAVARTLRSRFALPKRSGQLPWGASSANTQPQSAVPAVTGNRLVGGAPGRINARKASQAAVATATAVAQPGSSQVNASKQGNVMGPCNEPKRQGSSPPSQQDLSQLGPSGLRAAVPMNPWLARRKDQEQRQKRKARDRALAMRQQAEQGQLEAERQAADETAAASTASSLQSVQQQQEAICQQHSQQQAQTANATNATMHHSTSTGGNGNIIAGGGSSNLFGAASRHQAELPYARPAWQQRKQWQTQALHPLPPAFNIPSQRTPLQLQLQPQHNVLLDGVVRSSRRPVKWLAQQAAAAATAVKVPPLTATPEQQRQQRQVALAAGLVAPAAAATAATAAATAADDSQAASTGIGNVASVSSAAHIGLMPLVIQGGAAAGAAVNWSQPPLVSLPAHPSGPLQQPDTRNCLPGSCIAAAGVAAAASGNARCTRRTRSVQGAVSGAGPAVVAPPLPQVQGYGPACVPAVAAQQAHTAAGPMQLGDSLQGSASSNSDIYGSTATITSQIISSSGSSSDSGSKKHVNMAKFERQLQQLNSQNWQQLAEKWLPRLIDGWHCSMYTCMRDIWQYLLKRVASKQAAPSGQRGSVSPVSAAAVAAVPGVSAEHPSAAAPPPTATPTAAGADCLNPAAAAALLWCLTCLHHSQKFIWCSALLALIDTLMDDEALLSAAAVRVLPFNVLQELVMPAAQLVDEDVYAALADAVKRAAKVADASNSSTAAVLACLSNRSQGNGDNACSSKLHGRSLPKLRDIDAALFELRRLQPLYPGVEVPALAHMVLQHGVWVD